MTTAKLFKNGNSQAINIKKSILNQTNINLGDTFDVSINGNQIILTKQPSSIEERIKAFYESDETYNEPEINFGKAVGREIW